MSASCAVFLSIGQSVFNDRLASNLAQAVPVSVANNVISVGATSVRSVVNSAQLGAVLLAYSKSVTQVFVRILIPPLILIDGPNDLRSLSQLSDR